MSSHAPVINCAFLITIIILIVNLFFRYYLCIFQYGHLEIRDIIPFILPTLMSFVAPSIFDALKIWLILILLSSFGFGLVGINAAHHHPDIFHDGDIYRFVSLKYYNLNFSLT